jgi:hypothetical protein
MRFGLFFNGDSMFPDSKLTFANPGVTAAIGALITIPTVIPRNG